MKATGATVQEFSQLHSRYMEAQKKMLVLQEVSLEGMRKIGIGCTNEQAKAEFRFVKTEIESILARMKEICDSLD